MKKKQITRRPRRRIEAPKKCAFCESGKEPVFYDTESLSNFLTERGKIIGRSRNGLCAKHHRHLTIAIKHARHLALLPFVVRE